MSVSINGSAGLTFNDGSTQNTSPFAGGFGFRNRIINPDMRIDQRNAGASVTLSGTSNVYSLDRWVANSNGTPKFSIQRVTDAPTGFTNSVKLTTTTAGTPASGDFSYFGQYIEGFNVADLGFGSASASTITVSFWFKSSLTGLFGGSIRNASNNRSYPFSFTINAANTWEQKTVTIAGDTSGTWATDNSSGITLFFDTGSGSTNKGTAGAWNSTANIGVTGGTNLVATAGATINITGVQLEKGSTATSFDYRPYGTELALCQRYYVKMDSGGALFAQFANGICNAANSGQGFLSKLPVTMRTQPTATFSNLRVYDGAAAVAVSSFSAVSSCSNPNALGFDVSSSASFLTTGRPGTLQGDNSTAAFLAASAEL